AREAKKAAFTKYFPALNAGAASFKADKPLFNITSEGGNLPVYDGNPAHLPLATQFAYFPSSTIGMFGKGTFGMLNAIQPIFAGGRIVNGNRLASLGVEAGGYKEQLARNEVLLSTEEQYWRVVALDQKLKTVIRYEDFLTRLLVKVEAAYQAGLTMKNDVLKVKLKLSELKVNRSKLQNGREISAMAFSQHIGVPYDPQLELEEALPDDGTPDSFKADHRAVLPSRPEYKLLAAAVRSERLQSRLKLGEFLPQAGIGLAGIYMKTDEAEGTTNGMIYGTISIPLSGWWEAAHVMSGRKAREKIAQNNLTDHSEALLIQMEKAWQDLNDAHKLLQLAQEAQAQAEENLKVNEDSYENGMSDVSDLLEAQAMKQQALDQVADAAAGYRLKLVHYLQVTGR
ncbi:MAG: TolC family protein, partial [Acidobacteriota bacterium]|nr:TolC family protein [Acidobacteriota bacterium]